MTLIEIILGILSFIGCFIAGAFVFLCFLVGLIAFSEILEDVLEVAVAATETIDKHIRR